MIPFPFEFFLLMPQSCMIKKEVNSVQTHWTINDVYPIFIQEIILDGYLPCQDLHSIVHVLSLAPPKFDDFYPAHPDK